MKMRRSGIFASICAAALAAAMTLAGCQGGTQAAEPEGGGEPELKIWVRASDYRDYIDQTITMFEEETGDSIGVKVISDDSFADSLTQAFADGDGPDILLHYNDSELDRLGIEDNFLVLNDQKWVDTVMAGARAYCEDDNGDLIGFPYWESSVSGCYYNKKILGNLGLKPATTQAEFDMLCQALANVGHTPLFWGTQCGWMYQFGLDPIFSDNPELLEKLNAGEITYADIPEVRSMVKWIDDANKKGWLGDPLNKGMEAISYPLGSGDAVMIDIWDTWFETDFVPGEYGPDDFAIMPVFLGTAEEGTYEGGNLNMMMVNKNSEHLDEAISFLEFCATPSVYNEAFDGIPSDKVFRDQITITTTDMVLEASDSIERLQRASTANPKINGFSQADMMKAFSALLSGETDVDGCIAMMDEMRLAAKA